MLPCKGENCLIVLHVMYTVSRHTVVCTCGLQTHRRTLVHAHASCSLAKPTLWDPLGHLRHGSQSPQPPLGSVFHKNIMFPCCLPTSEKGEKHFVLGRYHTVTELQRGSVCLRSAATSPAFTPKRVHILLLQCWLLELCSEVRAACLVRTSRRIWKCQQLGRHGYGAQWRRS